MPAIIHTVGGDTVAIILKKKKKKEFNLGDIYFHMTGAVCYSKLVLSLVLDAEKKAQKSSSTTASKPSTHSHSDKP